MTLYEDTSNDYPPIVDCFGSGVRSSTAVLIRISTVFHHVFPVCQEYPIEALQTVTVVTVDEQVSQRDKISKIDWLGTGIYTVGICYETGSICPSSDTPFYLR